MEGSMHTATILILLNLQVAFAGTINPPANSCGSNQVGSLANGIVDCWTPMACPNGYGLTVEIGNVYPVGTRISCDLCIEGSTYSDKHDLSQCKNCTRCGQGEVAIGQCQIQKDSTVCHCKPGYFRSSHGSTQHSCKPCTSCCGQDNMDCRSSDARKMCSPDYTRCSNPHKNKSMNINETIGDPGSNLNRSPGLLPNRGGITLITLISIGLVLAVGTVAVFAVVYKQREGMPLRNHVLNNNDQRQEEHARFILEMHENDPHDRPQNITEVKLWNQGSNIEEENDSHDRPLDYMTEALTSEAGEILESLDSNGDDFMPSRRTFDTADTGNMTDNQRRQCIAVTQIPRAKILKLCSILDEEDDFYRDYRMLAQEYKMTEPEISSLKSTSSPTLTILEKYELNVESIVAVLESFFISQSCKKVAVASERTTALENMIDELRMCIGNGADSSSSPF